MATYAIGDIQGCYDPFCRLLEKINFDESSDTLWLAGDLVNRGPKSLQTLKFVKSLGDTCITVLGNHDIHLLALHYEVRARKDKDNTLFEILDTEGTEDLINWLQARPVLHIENNYILTHAGIHPHWSIDLLLELKHELETALKNIRSKEDLSELYGNTKGTWNNAETSDYRLRYALNCLTRMRYCDSKAKLDFDNSGAPGSQPINLQPWFEIDNPNLQDYTVLFGHWAALGYHQHNNIYALDSGCVWGNALTALRLEDKEVFKVKCKKKD